LSTSSANEPFKWIDAKGSVHIIKNAISPEMLRKRSPANVEIKKLPFHGIKRIKILDHEKPPLRKKKHVDPRIKRSFNSKGQRGFLIWERHDLEKQK